MIASQEIAYNVQGFVSGGGLGLMYELIERFLIKFKEQINS